MGENLPSGIDADRRHIPRSPLSDYVFGLFGMETHPEEATIVVGTSPVLLLKNNPARVGWIVTNHSASVIFVGFKPSMIVNTSLYLSPNGGSIQFSADRDGMAVVSEVYGISASSALIVSTIEIVIDAMRRG